ncbi:hypothetical protein [Izhakiella capsodis]|uniref:hypothetical protein n=1 Tax=Izhakiella capsodis TaxID=1367852 RepID=UPI0015A6435D|nr:hypothetical protein [Izhakiella capsodis]
MTFSNRQQIDYKAEATCPAFFIIFFPTFSSLNRNILRHRAKMDDVAAIQDFFSGQFSSE